MLVNENEKESLVQISCDGGMQREQGDDPR